jgi:Flp pilus assembly secretin CpaC
MLAALITIFANSIANAQETSYKAAFGQNKDAIAVNVLVGQSRVINFDRPVGRFSVSNPEIAEAVLVTPDQVLVNGKAFGQVNFIAWEQTGGQFLVFDVYVRANLSLIDSQIRALFPKDDVRHLRQRRECDYGCSGPERDRSGGFQGREYADLADVERVPGSTRSSCCGS